MSILDKCNYVASEYWYRLNGQVCWYDRDFQTWCTYKIDKLGNQMTETKYYANKAQVQAAERKGTFGMFTEDYSDKTS